MNRSTRTSRLLAVLAAATTAAPFLLVAACDSDTEDAVEEVEDSVDDAADDVEDAFDD